MDLNQITLIGRLGNNPTSITTKSGSSMCKLRLATNLVKKVGGEAKEFTEWHDIIVFGRQASTCLQFLSKGREIWVSGHIEYRPRKIGEVEIKEANIIADKVGFLGGKYQSKPEVVEEDKEYSEPINITSSVTGDSHSNSTHEVLLEQHMDDED